MNGINQLKNNTIKLLGISNTLYDRVLLWLLLGLSCVGFIVVSSGSVSLGMNIFHDPWYFMKRECFYYGITFLLSVFILKTPMITWQDYSCILFLYSCILLCVVLVINNVINGATRWITWGVFCAQPSELSKLAFIFYLADYLVRKSKEVCNTFWGICKPIIIMIILAFLLLAQPDFGSIIILFITTISILFLFGAKLWQLTLIFMLNMFLIILSIVFKPYRIQRILAFWNPWNDPFGNGYQLTQSLMAFGRGEYFGQGLGNSVQKLEYLPEAHTDFIFSVLAEELGWFGSVLVLLILFIIVFKAMIIGYYALNIDQKFSGILACAIGVWFGIQTFINIGVVSGVLPTKGLTLPFISYGGSSFLVTMIAGVLLLRIDFETRLAMHQAFLK